MEKIRLGISTCLTGAKVRYDGQHKRDSFLMDILSPFVDYITVCPEYECGLSIPREAMRLVGDVEAPKLLTIKTKTDITPQMTEWAKERLDSLEDLNLCGYVFKSKSPSSGLYRVKVYNDKSLTSSDGQGIFAKMFVERFPFLPVEEEGRLHDPYLREAFLDKIIAYSKWMKIMENPKFSVMTDFHADIKYTLMAHNPQATGRLGQHLSGGTKDLLEISKKYLPELMQALSIPTTTKKHTNVLDHLSGYLKELISSDEKRELHSLIEEYHDGLYPLLAPIVLIRHYARLHNIEYLLRQTYINPDPIKAHCSIV